MIEAITSFKDENRWLSNFWPAEVKLGDMVYATVEHGYVASKTLDITWRRAIQGLRSPGHAKRMGRQIPLRPDWEDVRLDIMEDLLRQKFAIPELRQLLLDTGDAMLIEGNTWNDTFWGAVIGDGTWRSWKGENNLGKLLMKIREECR
jgi:ribA/ribD-fused uncharacterized protein